MPVVMAPVGVQQVVAVQVCLPRRPTALPLSMAVVVKWASQTAQTARTSPRVRFSFRFAQHSTQILWRKCEERGSQVPRHPPNRPARCPWELRKGGQQPPDGCHALFEMPQPGQQQHVQLQMAAPPPQHIQQQQMVSSAQPADPISCTTLVCWHVLIHRKSLAAARGLTTTVSPCSAGC